MKRMIKKAKRKLADYLETRFPKPTEPRHVENVHPTDSRTLLTKEYVEAALAGDTKNAPRPQTIV